MYFKVCCTVKVSLLKTSVTVVVVDLQLQFTSSFAFFN